MMRSPRPVTLIDLETERFVLRPLQPLAFARQTLHWTADDEALHKLGWSKRRWGFRRWWRHLRHQMRKDRYSHGIWAKGRARPIGVHVLTITPNSGTAYLGVLIGERDWWGEGVVREARAAIIEDCFTRLGLTRVWGQVAARNFASIYNYQTLGFENEGILRGQNGYDTDGHRHDMICFGLLRQDWLDARGAATPEDAGTP